MLGKIKAFLPSLKLWGLAIMGGLLAILGIKNANLKRKLAQERQEDAEAQRDVLIKANQNAATAREEGRENERKAIEKANNGDWSGFNDGV